MLLFSFVIALFPRQLPRPVHSGKRNLPTLDSSASTMQRLNEEQPLTKAMLSDFMPVDPVSKQKETTHAADASAVMVEGRVLTDSGI
jgi:hypothetical protein